MEPLSKLVRAVMPVSVETAGVRRISGLERPPTTERRFLANRRLPTKDCDRIVVLTMGQWILLRRAVACCMLLLLLIARPAVAGIKETLEAIKDSEFRFARTTSEVPFMPMGWLSELYYPGSRFKDEAGVLPSATVAENMMALGAVLPAYVATRDMLLVGGDLAWDYIAVKSGPYRDQSVLRLTPVAGWLHQYGEDDLIGVFVAPIFSKEFRNAGPWGTGGYGGLIGMHWFSDQLQLLYGGVYENSYGRQAGYPYLGLQWMPTPRTSLSLVFPWPTFTCAPKDRWLVSVGIGPGGSSWVRRGDDFETVESLSSWNLSAGVGYRFHGNLWLYASAGLTGLRGVEIESDRSRTRFASQPGAVFSLAIQFRP